MAEKIGTLERWMASFRGQRERARARRIRTYTWHPLSATNWWMAACNFPRHCRLFWRLVVFDDCRDATMLLQFITGFFVPFCFFHAVRHEAKSSSLSFFLDGSFNALAHCARPPIKKCLLMTLLSKAAWSYQVVAHATWLLWLQSNLKYEVFQSRNSRVSSLPLSLFLSCKCHARFILSKKYFHE